jgi:ParB-like nuclease domain
MIQVKAIKLVPIKDLKPNPGNRNTHSDEQIERLVKIIKYQGFRNPLIVSNQSGYLVAGHGRLMAAALMGLKEVPVTYQDFESSEQEYAAMVSDNSIASWAELDLSAINGDIPDLGPDFDIDLLGIKDFLVDPADKEGSEEHAKMTDLFGVPPFSILDTRQGYWQERRRSWLAIGIKSEIGRTDVVAVAFPNQKHMKTMMANKSGT